MDPSNAQQRVQLARGFLTDILQPERLSGFERFWLRVDDQNVPYDGFDRLMETVARVKWYVGTAYFAPHAYLPRGRRVTENIVQLCNIGIDWDDRTVDEAAEHLDQFGIVANWLTATRPDRAQAIIKLPPWRLAPGKYPDRAREIRDRVDDVVKDLVKVLGADTGAASVNQLFRLPGSRRQLDDGIWTVRAEHIRSQPTTVAQLEAVLATHRRRRRASRKNYHSGESHTYSVSDPSVSGRCLTSPHCRWLLSHRIARGHRGNAAFKLTVAHRLDNISEEQAVEQLSDWRAECTEDGPGGDGKPFTDSDIRVIARGVYRRSEPWGIDWRSSADIQDVNGETMGEATAQTIKAGMPDLEKPETPPAKPLEELQNLKAPQQLLTVLAYFVERAKRERSATITVTQRQTAEATGVPIDTLKRTIWDWLDNAGVKVVVQWYGVLGRARATAIDVDALLRLAKNPHPADDGILDFTPSSRYRLGASGIVAYWLRRLRSVVDALARLAESALSELEMALAEVDSGVKSEDALEASSVDPRGRDPPVRNVGADENPVGPN